MEFNHESLKRLRQDVGADNMPLIMQHMQLELQQRIDSLNQGLAARDAEVLQSDAHRVKSTARTLGLDAIADAAELTETAARSGQATVFEHSAELIALCEQGLALINQQLP